MTDSNPDLRLWARIANVAVVATALGAVTVGPWLGVLIIVAVALSRRGQLLLFGPHIASQHRQNASSRWAPATIEERTQPRTRRAEHPGDRTRRRKSQHSRSDPPTNEPAGLVKLVMAGSVDFARRAGYLPAEPNLDHQTDDRWSSSLAPNTRSSGSHSEAL
jgi:hypothetical protein